VRWVAVPDAALDFSANEERRLIDGGLPYLKLRARLDHWRIYEHSGTLAEPRHVAAVTQLEPAGFTLRAHRPGAALVRVRWTPYWQAPGACVERAPGGWTRVTTRARGTVRVTARFSLGRVVHRGRRCSAVAG
jgi:hypothetical protein